MKNASAGRVSSPSHTTIASISRPKGRTTWTAGPIDAGVDAKMCNSSVKSDATSGVKKGTKY